MHQTNLRLTFLTNRIISTMGFDCKRISLVSLTIISILAIVFTIKFMSHQKIVKQGLHSIPIAMGTDDNYALLTLVAITSAMENIGPSSYYHFYIMHPNALSSESKNRLLEIEKMYKKCKVSLINMNDQFKDVPINKNVSFVTYYRLVLANALPNIEKIIWLDSDVLVLDDLYPMYSLSMKNLHFRGLFDDYYVTSQPYICAGVLLINLNELRLDHMVSKFYDFINNNTNSLTQNDQTVINVVSRDKLGYLPPFYGIFTHFYFPKIFKKYSKKVEEQNVYSLIDLRNAIENPAILHFTKKPWNIKLPKLQKLWNYYSSKTKFYKEIMEFIKQKQRK